MFHLRSITASYVQLSKSGDYLITRNFGDTVIEQENR